MNDKSIDSKLGHFLIFLVLAASGNVEFRQFKLVNLFIMVLLLYIVFIFPTIGRNFLSRKFFKTYFSILAILSILFILHKFMLGFVTPLGILNMFAKIFISGLVIHLNRDQFIHRLFNVLFVISLISLAFYGADIILGGIYRYIPSPFVVGDRFYYFFYHSRADMYNGLIARNAGMFWEPGVFSSYLIICLALVFPRLEDLSRKRKNMLLIIFIALLTTMSTTGYILAFIVFLSSNLLKKKLKIKYVVLSILLIIVSLYVFNNTAFLGDKFENQTATAISSDGEFNSTRLGSLLFDWYYIKKHPLIGNGIHEKTKYADHPWLQDTEYEIGNGNGFSQFVSSYGVVFVLLFCYLLFKKINLTYNHKIFSFVFVFIFLLNLNGEPLMTYPFYWGLIFLAGKQRIGDKYKVQSPRILASAGDTNS
jgi:hypothetical protein